MENFLVQPTLTRPPSVLDAPETGIDISAILLELADRLYKAERKVEYAVDEKALARIILTDKDIFMSGDQVTIVGQLNIVDWIRDISGNPVDGIDASSMTRIVGGKIQTGSIFSANWTTTTGSKIDLDHGIIALGGSTSPKFQVDSNGNMTCTGATVTGTLAANSIIANTVTIDGITIGAIATGSAQGSAAYLGLTYKIDKNASYVMGASSEFKTSGFDSGNGMNFTNNGIIARKGGNNTFVISNDGTATFAGALSAASGSFAGDLVTGGNVECHGLSSVSVYLPKFGLSVASSISGTGATVVSGYLRSGLLGVGSAASGLIAGVVGYAAEQSLGYGVIGYGSSVGVYGQSSGSSGVGVLASNEDGGVGLQVSGAMTTNNTVLVTNLNSDYLDGYHADSFVRATGSATTGSATATLAANKPGSNSSCVWVPISVGGATAYIPIWS